MRHRRSDLVLRLRVGEAVEVRTAEEILATLDDGGRLDALPFMPEMLDFCGRRFKVFKRADKVNDLVENSGLRRMLNTVILDGVRCDGASHGGCQAGCQILWKEAWLRRLKSGAAANPREIQRAPESCCTPSALERAARTVHGAGPTDEERFVCQATEMKAASARLNPWDVRQYVRDVRSGNVGMFEAVGAMSVWLFNAFQRARGGARYPEIGGNLKRTPRGLLNLQTGELVRIKSRDEIVATLDRRLRTRGLRFDAEMVKYCGGEYRVLKRVERIIEEKSGKMIELSNDCIILDGVSCVGDYHRFYPQNEYLFWREAWLERVGPASEPE